MKRRVTSGVLLAMTLALVSPVSAPFANAAKVADPTSACELNIPTSSVTADSSSVAVSVSGIYCVAEFKTVGTYSITIPGMTTALDYLVVAGGGGGASGGGGGGGVLQGSNFPVAPEATVNISVGGGGTGGNGGNIAAGAARGVAGGKGGNSSFGSATAIGGGGGSSAFAINGDGGSGGGAAWDCMDAACTKTVGPAGTAVAGQGNNGGYSTYISYGAGGGGGGAGGAGFNTVQLYIGGNGGVGIASSITGTSKFYAGGGGGGVNNNDNKYVGLDASNTVVLTNVTAPQTTGGGQGGLGGGGRGSSFGRTSLSTEGQYANATAGAANTGGGGGGTDPEDIKAGAGGSGTVILRWVAAANLRAITFNSNFGTATTTLQRVTTGVSTPLQPATFTRPGFIFSGWNTAADGSGSAYAGGANFSTTTDTTLYAVWRSGVNRSATFDANGGSGTLATQVAGIPTALSTNTFTRTGFTFTGWNSLANGLGYAYANNAFYSFDADATFYAQWRPASTLRTVNFYGNGATGGTTPAQTAGATTPLTGNGFTYPGKSFLGWNTNNAATTATYLDLAPYSFTTDLSLYAIWVPQASNVVTYNGNTSTGGATAPQTASVSTVVSTNGFTKDGYTFIAWNSQADGLGASYTAGYSYSFAAGITLYAKWSKNLSITYNANASDSGAAPSAQSYYVGGPDLTVSTNTGLLARSGYTLAGWNSAANGSGSAYALGGSNARFTTDTVLYAQWLAASNTITYNGNGNTAGIAPPSQSFVSGGAGVVIRDNIDVLVKTGFTFGGWNTTADATGTSYAAGAIYTEPVSRTLYAKWIQNKVETATATFAYSIAFAPNLGVGSMATLTGTNSTVKLPPNTFTRTGFRFIGWKNAAGADVADGATITLTAITTLILTAQWEAVVTTPIEPDKPADVLVDKIISIAPTKGYANDEITITGEFNYAITSISVDGLLLAPNSWKQDKTTVKFNAPGHDVGIVDIKLVNGRTPELTTQKFEYIALKQLEKEIGISGILCLGTFEKACPTKPGALQPVSFKLNSNALSTKSVKILKSWKLETAKSVIVYGYASKQGSKALNDKLTKKRAAEVGAWVKKNWPNLTVKTVGLGTKNNRLCKPFNNKCAMIKIVSLKK